MRKTLIVALAGLSLLASACAVDIEANADGSLTVESFIAEADLQDAIDKTIDDPEVEDLDVDFRDGHIAVEGKGKNEADDRINTVSFEAILSVDDGHLGVEIYDAVWNGEPMPDWIVEAWNTALADELERQGREDPDSTLVRVDVTDDDITMEWHVETDASRD